MEQLGFTAIKPLVVPRRFFWNSITSKVLRIDFRHYHRYIRCPAVSAVVGYNRCLRLCISSSMALISSLVISTALNTKSTLQPLFLLRYIHYRIFFTASGMGVSIFQRPPQLPHRSFLRDLGLAATVTTSNQGWFSSREIKLCPTIPVAPNIPTLQFLLIFSLLIFLKYIF